jgi:hypothetical protein
MALLAVTMVVFILGGCASVPTASLEYERMAAGFTPPPGMASVYVYRTYTTVGSALLDTVSIDDQRLGTVGPNTCLFGNIEPGSHIMTVSDNKFSKVAKFDAKAGNLYFFKVHYSSGLFDIQLNVEPVNEREGREKIIGYKLSGDNMIDRASIVKSLNVDYVLIAHKVAAYTVFVIIPKGKIESVKMKIQTEKEMEMVVRDDFTHHLDKYVKAKILKDDYPGSMVVEGIPELLGKYPETPVGLTWNGGIAITVNDYRHAEKTLKQYQNNPAEYEHVKIQDSRLDPVNPKNHLGPLLGWQ